MATVKPRKDGTFELRESKRVKGKVKTKTLAYLGKCPTVEAAYWHYKEEATRPKQPKETVLQADKRRVTGKHYVAILEKYRTPEDRMKAEMTRRELDAMKEAEKAKRIAVNEHQFCEAWSKTLAKNDHQMPTGPLKRTAADYAVEQAKKRMISAAIKMCVAEITAPIMKPIYAEQERSEAERKLTARVKTAEVKMLQGLALDPREIRLLQDRGLWVQPETRAPRMPTKAELEQMLEKNQQEIEASVHDHRKLESLCGERSLLAEQMLKLFPPAHSNE